jgi:hypothetical protein
MDCRYVSDARLLSRAEETAIRASASAEQASSLGGKFDVSHETSPTSCR